MLKEIKKFIELGELLSYDTFKEVKKRKKQLKALYPEIVVVSTTLHNPYNGHYIIFETEWEMVDVMGEWELSDLETCKKVDF
jgi:hypothetical protein